MVDGDVNLFGRKVVTVKENIEASLVVSNEIGTEVNAEKSKCMFMPCQQVIGNKCNRRITNKMWRSSDIWECG